MRAHSSRIIRCGYVGLTLCGAGPLYSLDSTRGDGINRSLSRSLRHRLIQTHLRDGQDGGGGSYGDDTGGVCLWRYQKSCVDAMGPFDLTEAVADAKGPSDLGYC